LAKKECYVSTSECSNFVLKRLKNSKMDLKKVWLLSLSRAQPKLGKKLGSEAGC
jgi:hypothetical protein